MPRVIAIALLMGSGCFGWGHDDGSYYEPNQVGSVGGANEATQLAGALWEAGAMPLRAGEIFTSRDSISSDLHSSLPFAVARALRAIGRYGNICTVGTATSVPTGTTTSTCQYLGPYGSGVYSTGGLLTLNNCRLDDGSLLNGTVATTNTEALAAGAVCGPTAKVNSTHTSTTNLTYTTAAKQVITYTNLNSLGSATRVLGQEASTYSLTIASGERRATDAAGNLTADQSVAGNVTVTFVGYNREETGMITVADKLTRDYDTLTESSVTTDNNCCNPISGTVTWTDFTADDAGTDDAGTNTIHTLTFGPNCGETMYDGVSSPVSCRR